VWVIFACFFDWKADESQCIQLRTGKKLMSNGASSLRKNSSKVTLQRVYDEVVELRKRVEDLEDLRELNAAIARNKGKKLISWAKAKRELALED